MSAPAGGAAAPAPVPLGPGDLDDVLELNRANVPHVGALERPALERLVGQCTSALAVRGGDGDLDGVVLVLGPGADYASPNYRFFDDRHGDFRYVDRVAVSARARRRGLGRALYAAAAAGARAAGVPVLCAEVNVTPPNPGSTAFHAALGFVEVGRQWTYGDTVEVQLLELDLR